MALHTPFQRLAWRDYRLAVKDKLSLNFNHFSGISGQSQCVSRDEDCAPNHCLAQAQSAPITDIPGW
jgi:hypothetical protein